MTYRHKSEFSQETQDWSLAYKGSDAVLPIMELAERLAEVEKQLLILRPHIERLEKHPALKEAYEAYKILDNLIGLDEKR